jgi:hypothetical protein
MNCQSIVTLVLVLSVFSCFQVYGHRPIEAKETPDRHTRALNIARPDVSQVYYGALDVERPQVWFRFEGKENQEIYFSVGVPVIDSLKEYRPNLALIGPGLDGPGLEASGFESGEPPLPVPQNLEVEIYLSRGRPRFFHEHFTGTDSWIHIEVTRKLRRSGTYYLVAYTPADPKPGDKLWLTMGTKERFKLRDLFTFRRWKREIREFHELR